MEFALVTNTHWSRHGSAPNIENTIWQ